MGKLKISTNTRHTQKCRWYSRKRQPASPLARRTLLTRVRGAAEASQRDLRKGPTGVFPFSRLVRRWGSFRPRHTPHAQGVMQMVDGALLGQRTSGFLFLEEGRKGDVGLLFAQERAQSVPLQGQTYKGRCQQHLGRSANTTGIVTPWCYLAPDLPTPTPRYT